MRVNGSPTAGTAVCARLFLSSVHDGSERMTGGWLSVRVSERLRAVCFPFSVLREAFGEARNGKPGPCLASGPSEAATFFPSSVFRAVPLASVGDQWVGGNS